MHQDIRQVHPRISVLACHTDTGAFLYYTARWSEDGFWESAQPYRLPQDWLGRRIASSLHRDRCKHERENVKYRIRTLGAAFKELLHHASKQTAWSTIMGRAGELFSKTAALARILCYPGSPLHMALDWLGSVHHRAAICSLLVGDWL